MQHAILSWRLVAAALVAASQAAASDRAAVSAVPRFPLDPGGLVLTRAAQPWSPASVTAKTMRRVSRFTGCSPNRASRR